MMARPPHDISVLMPAYNAERHILQSVQSVLAQTYEDFELIVVNDCSMDATRELLSGIADRRLRILDNPHNLGVVGSLNRAMSEASGRYIARIDADDFCLPTRFTKQRHFLDRHPQVMLVGTEMSVLSRGVIRFSRPRANPDPKIIQWMLHASNPVGHPSMMFRADVVHKLGTYLQEAFKYAEDFDFSHRVLGLGQIAVLPEHLVVYRQHGLNLTQTRRAEMIGKTIAVLCRVYAGLFGSAHDAEAGLVAEHLVAGNPIKTPTAIEQLGAFLNHLIDRFDAVHALNEPQRHAIIQHTGRLWWNMIQRALQAGHIGSAARYHGHYRWSAQTRPSPYRIARSMMAGLVRSQPASYRRPPPAAFPARNVELRVNDVAFHAAPVRPDDPPSLYVVVDTEAEFDWAQSFARSATSVSSMRQQILAQTIFDRYGARPIYVVDYAVASQAEGYEPLREIFDRHGCAIGAHLHPWINPPFEEVVSDHNSFAGNLPAGLEERKLRVLVLAIERSFGVTPLFFKAGRYGVGRSTMDTLRRLGFAVDFSIMPMADMRARGGPDFRFATSQPYHTGAGRLLSIPMTRGQLGVMTPMSPQVHSALHSAMATRLHLPGILSHMRLANTVTLTPEGVSPEEQVQLIRSMAARGHRTFVLHYHSPSLGQHTPYVRNEAELTSFLHNIEHVCDYFFLKMGGLPGNPADLVPPAMRERIWSAERQLA